MKRKRSELYTSHDTKKENDPPSQNSQEELASTQPLSQELTQPLSQELTQPLSPAPTDFFKVAREEKEEAFDRDELSKIKQMQTHLLKIIALAGGSLPKRITSGPPLLSSPYALSDAITNGLGFIERFLSLMNSDAALLDEISSTHSSNSSIHLKSLLSLYSLGINMDSMPIYRFTRHAKNKQDAFIGLINSNNKAKLTTSEGTQIKAELAEINTLNPTQIPFQAMIKQRMDKPSTYALINKSFQKLTDSADEHAKPSSPSI